MARVKEEKEEILSMNFNLVFPTTTARRSTIYVNLEMKGRKKKKKNTNCVGKQVYIKYYYKLVSIILFGDYANISSNVVYELSYQKIP